MKNKPVPKIKQTIDPFTREVYVPGPGPVLRPGALDYKKCPSHGMTRQVGQREETPGKWRGI